MKRKILVILGVLLSLSILLVACGASKLDIEELLEIREKGINGFGRVQTRVNSDYANSIMKEILSKDKKTDSFFQGSQEFLYLDSLHFEIVGDNNNLSNGDIVIIKVIEDEQLAKAAKMKLNKTEIEYTVSGLSEGEVYDAFGNLELIFEGEDGTGYVYYEIDNFQPFYIDYLVVDESGNTRSIWDIDNLSNGDELRLQVDYDQEWAMEEGYLIKETEKTYKIEGLIEYDKIEEDILFDHFIYSFENASPYLSMSVENTLPDDLYGYFNYYVEPSYDLKIGDLVTVGVYADEWSLKEAGKSFPAGEATREYELTEDMVPRYISTTDELTKEDKNFLKDEAEDYLRVVIANQIGSYSSRLDTTGSIQSITEPSLEEIYFLYPKESMMDKVYGDVNRLGFLFKVIVEQDKIVEGYNFISFNNLKTSPSEGFDLNDIDVSYENNFYLKDDLLNDYIEINRDIHTVTKIELNDF